MGFFEQELRKIVDAMDSLDEIKYDNGTCDGKIGDNRHVTLEFVSMSFKAIYEGIKVTVINEDEGMFTSKTLIIPNVLGTKSVPGNRKGKTEEIQPQIHHWVGSRYEWSQYQPTQEDYKKLANALNDYIGMFME